RGHLWVTDFGLARIQAEAGLSETGDVVGTLRYMSPEQALGKHGLVDHRADVYGLGVTLYELLTLRPALDGRDRQELFRALGMEGPAPPARPQPIGSRSCSGRWPGGRRSATPRPRTWPTPCSGSWTTSRSAPSGPRRHSERRNGSGGTPPPAPRRSSCWS